MPVGKLRCRDTKNRPRTSASKRHPHDRARSLRSGDIVPPLRSMHEASEPGKGLC
jgi:hypothetical protein